MSASPLTAYPKTAAHLRKLVREAILDHDALNAPVKPCELKSCRATCCHDGVSLSDEEHTSIENLVTSNQASFADILRHQTAADLFETQTSGNVKTATLPAGRDQLATDFPTHFPKTRCVLLDQNDHCSLQRFSIKQNLPQWFHKPLTCWLHPILIQQIDRQTRPIITLPDPKSDPQTNPSYPGFASCTHCGRPDQTGTPAHLALEPELTMLSKISDRNLLAELRAPSLD